MKTLILTIFLSALSLCKAQTYTSSCLPLDTIGDYYLEDARALNLRYIFQTNNTNKDSIKFNQAITNMFHRALLAVYNATAAPVRDSVVRKWKIKADNQGLHEILIRVNPNLPWVINLKNNVYPTGKFTIDSLITKHYLKQVYYTNTPGGQFTDIILKSDTAFNQYALHGFLQRVPEISYVQLNENLGFRKPDIQDTVTPSAHHLYYIYDFQNECSYGCSFSRSWKVIVHNDCSVTFAGYYPLFVGIKSYEAKSRKVKVYPNPTTGKSSLEGVPDNAIISVTDILGRTIASTNSDLDLTGYMPGIYFISILSADQKIVVKVVKE